MTIYDIRLLGYSVCTKCTNFLSCIHLSKHMLYEFIKQTSGVAKDGPGWAHAHPNFLRIVAPACFCYYEQATNSAYLGSTIFSL